MTTAVEQQVEPIAVLPQYRSILIAADSSDHSNQAVEEAVKLAAFWNSTVTGTHAYAAKMHDIRFRQMEGGLPEQYRVEQELEHQRKVHDDLITRGLSIITDSYLDQVEQRCKLHNLVFQRSSLEGKNYRALVNEANHGDYDLLVMGALGVGAIEGSRVGTVCNRTVRRSNIDTLVIKQPKRALSDGPLVVALDGSRKSYHALLTAFTLAKQWQVEVKVIATFDPYYHYVAFNRIADVLSDEAGKVFKFKQQEKLHEDIIDSGLAKIYQGHLDVAQSIADDYGVEIETSLLDGKAYDAIQKYVAEVDASLLLIGKLGIHADAELDIGGNAENLLQRVDCALMLCMQEHQPRIEEIAAATTSWSVEAEQRMLKVPTFVRPMARMAILRYAQEKGHTVITESIVEAATAELMPGHAESAIEEIVNAADRGELKKSVTTQVMVWTDAADSILQGIGDESLRLNLKGRAEKKARADKTWQVEAAHINAFIKAGNAQLEEVQELHWQADAIARLMRAPQGFMRAAAKNNIEQYARDNEITEISFEVAEKGLEISRQAMQQQVANGERPAPRAGKCPFAGKLLNNPDEQKTTLPWAEGAKARLDHIPEGYCRNMTYQAIESIAAQSGQTAIDASFIESILATFQKGSDKVRQSLPWHAAAEESIANAPAMVRGMLIQEIESWAKQQQQAEVTAAMVDQVKQQWSQSGLFHLDPADPRNNG
jgi:nucleotide-binding universal stress UspA family protein